MERRRKRIVISRKTNQNQKIKRTKRKRKSQNWKMPFRLRYDQVWKYMALGKFRSEIEKLVFVTNKADNIFWSKLKFERDKSSFKIIQSISRLCKGWKRFESLIAFQNFIIWPKMTSEELEWPRVTFQILICIKKCPISALFVTKTIFSISDRNLRYWSDIT